MICSLFKSLSRKQVEPGIPGPIIIPTTPSLGRERKGTRFFSVQIGVGVRGIVPPDGGELSTCGRGASLNIRVLRRRRGLDCERVRCPRMSGGPQWFDLVGG